MKIPQKVDTVNVYVIVKSTLPFLRREGHRYTVGFEGGGADCLFQCGVERASG